ncbi:MAG: hybrid sensor histidine kinase/response regulator, partial [Gammaproteobacteria bacterium]
MTQTASDSLLWIKNELDNTLLRSRQALEAYAENPEDRDSLKHCLAYLHQVQGTLRVVEVYGAAILAREMEAVARALWEDKIKDVNEAFEILMRAMLQLPDYLERVISGQREVPLALLSLVNDLRSVRGDSLLSESELFAQNLAGRPVPTHEDRTGAARGDIAAVAGKLRPKFQAALLGWYKGDKPASHLRTLGAICEKLEEAANTPPVFQLWWVVGGIMEALVDGGLEADVSLKQLLGQVDRQIKRLVDEGEDAVSAEPPSEL